MNHSFIVDPESDFLKSLVISYLINTYLYSTLKA